MCAAGGFEHRRPFQEPACLRDDEQLGDERHMDGLESNLHVWTDGLSSTVFKHGLHCHMLRFRLAEVGCLFESASVGFAVLAAALTPVAGALQTFCRGRSFVVRAKEPVALCCGRS